MGLWRDKRLTGDPARGIKPVTNATVEREINCAIHRHRFTFLKTAFLAF